MPGRWPPVPSPASTSWSSALGSIRPSGGSSRCRSRESRETPSGRWSVGRSASTAVVRSFVSIPAGVARMPLPRFTVLTALGCVPWCFGLAGAGWALGSSYERLHHDFRYVDIAVVVLLLLLAVAWYIRRRRSIRLARRAADPAR